METGERLAAYLAGELDTDETRALEAELARDPALRTRLARLRRLETELADLGPVDVPADFSARLRSALRDELDATPLAGDELAARRAAKQQRGTPRWFPLAAGAAAVLALVVGGTTVFTNVFGSGADSAGDDETAEIEAMTADEDAGTAIAAADTAAGPVIVVQGSDYDDADLTTLPRAELFQGIVDERLSSASAEAQAESFFRVFPELAREAWRASSGTDGTAEDAAASGESTESAPAEPLPPDAGGSLADLQTYGGPLDETAQADIGRCLGPIWASAETLIPVYVELATYEGEPAIVYGFASLDRDTGEYTRIEVWAVSRVDCTQLFFSQQDR